MSITEDAFMNLYINGKKVWFTAHINEEMDEENKDRLFVAEIVDRGEKILTSKKEAKYESHLNIGEFEWLVSFAEGENTVVLMHLGKKRR